MASPYTNEAKEMTIEPGCPWFEAQQTYGAPNVNWCEPMVCGYINEPANTWSNLPYLIIGLVLLKKIKTQPLRAFPYAVFVMGALSFVFHATNNYLTQYLDFLGMFLMMSFLVAFNFKRLFPHSFRFFSVYWFWVFLNSMLFTLFGIMDIAVQWIMYINFAPIVLLELYNGYKANQLKSYGFLGLALISIIVAQTFAILDITRTWCEPENLILHGHVVWHFFAAAGMYFAAMHLQRVWPKN